MEFLPRWPSQNRQKTPPRGRGPRPLVQGQPPISGKDGPFQRPGLRTWNTVAESRFRTQTLPPPEAGEEKESQDHILLRARVGGPALLTPRTGPLSLPFSLQKVPSANRAPRLWIESLFLAKLCVERCWEFAGSSHLGSKRFISLSLTGPLVLTQACQGNAFFQRRGRGSPSPPAPPAPPAPSAGQGPQSWNLKAHNLDPTSSQDDSCCAQLSRRILQSRPPLPGRGRAEEEKGPRTGALESVAWPGAVTTSC